MMPPGLKGPGARSSEFLVTIANVAAQIVLAWTGEISTGSAVKYGTAGAIAYAIARGLAKYETRDASGGVTGGAPQA